MKDYYSLLGIEQKATKAEIKKNYRLLATKYHPDKSSDPGSAEKFIAITEAYDTLSNRKSRARYDLLRWQALKKKQATQESFRTVVPTRESTRTRKNKAQQKRSLNYHKAKGQVKKTALLILECLYILSRYTVHILAITLLAAILRLEFSEIPAGFDSGIISGVLLSAFAAVLTWGIYKLSEIIFTEIKKDLALFSIYYKITHRKVLFFAVPVFAFIIFLYLGVLLLR